MCERCESVKNGLVKQGNRLGYPKCCIDAYVDMKNHGGTQLNHDTVFNGTGYIPCKECAKLDPNELLKIIDAKRSIRELPFPLNNVGAMNISASVWQDEIGYIPTYGFLYQCGKPLLWKSVGLLNDDLMQALELENDLGPESIVCMVSTSELIASFDDLNPTHKLYWKANDAIMSMLDKGLKAIDKSEIDDNTRIVCTVSSITKAPKVNRYINNNGCKLLTIEGKPIKFKPTQYVIKLS